MARHIDKAIIEETKKCPFSFQCLDDRKRAVCKVSAYIEKNGCIIGKIKNQPCPYKKLIGRSTWQCTCPTRHELYKQYRI